MPPRPPTTIVDRRDGPAPATVDLLVVGGGVNGAGIARDAAGRGLSVVLCEKDDLAEGTSSRSGKLVHGGLRYLEYYEFRLVREALIEREVLLAAAPHIIWPMRFVLPHHKGLRPAWFIRLGLILYDHLGGRRKLPGTRVIRLRDAPEGRPLKPEFKSAFEYSDCWVDDARLVVLNAKAAQALGADVRPRTALVSARPEGAAWRARLRDRRSGTEREVVARCLVNAAGPWVEQVLNRALGRNAAKRVRLVKGSHIVTRRLFDGPQAYLIQHTDRRVIFVNPYEDDFCLIGTTDVPYESDADDVRIDAGEVDYLCAAVNRYFARPIAAADVVHAFAGVRPLFDDEADNPSAVTRDYVFDVDGGPDRPVLLSIFGGKITTYRKLSEHALERLRPYFPAMRPAWTAGTPLPGGDMPGADFDAYARQFQAARPWLDAATARHLLRRHGTTAEHILGDAKSAADLGTDFGAGFSERELRYFVDEEWAAALDDILWRRTKLGLHLSRPEVARLERWLAHHLPGVDATPPDTAAHSLTGD